MALNDALTLGSFPAVIPAAGPVQVLAANDNLYSALTAAPLSIGNAYVQGTPAPPRTKRKLIEKLDEHTSIKDYGAVGDGVTDDTAAIVAAIAGCVSAGITNLFVPDGTYLVSSEIQVPQHVRLEGAGGGQQNFAGNFKGAVFRAKAASFPSVNDAVLAFVYSTDSANPDHRHFGGAFNLVVDGQRTTGNLCRGIRLAGVRYVTVYHCGVYKCGDSGIYVGSAGVSSNDICIERNDVMWNSGYGIEFYGGDSFILDNTVAQNTLDGIAGQPGSTIIRGNACWFNKNGVHMFTGALAPAITGNYLYDNYQNGLRLATVPNVLVCGNQMSTNGRDTSGSVSVLERAGMRIAGTASGVLTGNMFGNQDSAGIATQQYGLSIDGNAVFGMAQSTNRFNQNIIATISDPNGTVQLTAATTTLPVDGRTYIVLSSDSAVVGARVMKFNSGIQFGQVLVLRWSGTNTGRLADNTTMPDGGGIIRLNGVWDPNTDQANLVLVFTNGGWSEMSRSAP
jgi:hypothetical protein